MCPLDSGKLGPYILFSAFKSAPVAQLDRVLDYESRGRKFESSRVHHNLNKERGCVITASFSSSRPAFAGDKIASMQTEGYASQRSEHKACSKCKTVKTVSEFSFRHKSTGVRHSYCKECGKALTRSHYANNKRQYLERNIRSYSKRREFVRRMKSRPCADCGQQYPYYVMDFDHREGEVKKYALNSTDRMTMRAILREIEKCDVVCSNCHRMRTYKRRNKSCA